MAKTVDQYFRELQQTRVWRSIFRSGTGSSTLKRALAIQQNVFLHLFSTKVRTRMLSFNATWYLGTLTLGTFLILVATGIPLMLYYHPSAPQAYADTKDLQFVVSSGMFLRNLHRWSAHAMVFLVFAHMFKVFYRGAYRALWLRSPGIAGGCEHFGPVLAQPVHGVCVGFLFKLTRHLL